MVVRGHSTRKYIHSQRLETSAARRWTNILAERWSHSAGELPPVLPRDTELAVLLRGETFVERRGDGRLQQTSARPGTVWLCPAGIREDYVRADANADDCLHIFLPQQPFDDAVLQDLDLDPARVALRYEAIGYDAFIVDAARRICDELQDETSAGRLLVEALGTALSAHLISRYAATDVKPRTLERVGREAPLDPRRLRRVVAYIEANLEAAFTVADLAQEACLSPAHFARCFKAATGVAPHAYISGQRLERAKRRLAEDADGLADIALASGFSSQANFTRAFRRSVGISPGHYRRSLRRG